jgi:hypothetical protein
MRFETGGAPIAQVPLALGIDPYHEQLAEGLLLMSNEVRVLRPTVRSGGAFAMTMVRALVQSPAQRRVSLAMGDITGEGLVEAIGGQDNPDVLFVLNRAGAR